MTSFRSLSCLELQNCCIKFCIPFQWRPLYCLIIQKIWCSIAKAFSCKNDQLYVIVSLNIVKPMHAI